MQTPSTAVMILAAGASVRLGRPKQNLIYQGQTLVQKIVSTASALQSGPVLLVLNEHDKIAVQEDIIILHNPDAAMGMATSIHCGIRYLENHHPDIETVIVTVCDQPFITTQLFEEMIVKYRDTHLPIIACKYDDIIGTPVLFHKTMFNALLTLKGDKGAKQLINQHAQKVGLINFPLGNIDVDTEEDYERLIKS